VRARPWRAASVLVVSAASLSGCIKIGEDGWNFTVVNHTNQTLTIVPRTQAPGQPPDSYSGGSDQPFTLSPGGSLRRA
jgi:hypothetical protein